MQRSDLCPICDVGIWVELWCVRCKGQGFVPCEVVSHVGTRITFLLDPDWCRDCGGISRYAACSDSCMGPS